MSSWRAPGGPRMRVVCDNDYSGDPDGLVQLAHHALSPSVELVTIIGSHLRADDPFDSSGVSADNAADKAREVLRLAGREDVPVVAGSNVALSDRATPIESAGARAIIEAATADSQLPLYACFGAGLTELASAWLLEPAISHGIRQVVWIGGAEHAGVTAPPGAPAAEYNTAIDPIAAQVVFNDSDLPIWQVPRNTYRETLASFPEMAARMRDSGALGAHLFDALEQVAIMCARGGVDIGETYVLGDSPLVLLTALQSSFEPFPSSSRFRDLPAPIFADDGSYAGTMDERTVRVWEGLDMALMMRDFYAKLQLHG